jgi:hypothetical protein
MILIVLNCLACHGNYEGQLPQLNAALSDEGSEPPAGKSDFATARGQVGEVRPVPFDGQRAKKYLQQLCDLGPRISGTEGMKKQQELLESHFRKLGATVQRQEFKVRQLSQKEQTPMVNLIVSWHPHRQRRILIASHYDTRPIADQEPNRAHWSRPFLSANDGTSGVAFLMELGHHMKDLKTEFGIDFVFFDGEEYVFETAPLGGGDKYFFGSEHFAAEYVKSRATRTYRYDAGVLLDLFAGKDAQLKIEMYSWDAARPLVEQIWGVAKTLGARSFVFQKGYEVLDDHIALIRAGIPTVDIIDFDYPHWHRLSDTPDKVSPEQMREVSDVLTVWLQKIR